MTDMTILPSATSIGDIPLTYSPDSGCYTSAPITCEVDGDTITVRVSMRLRRTTVPAWSASADYGLLLYVTHGDDAHSVSVAPGWTVDRAWRLHKATAALHRALKTGQAVQP